MASWFAPGLLAGVLKRRLETARSTRPTAPACNWPQVCYRPQLGPIPIRTCDSRIVEVNDELVRARSVGRCTQASAGDRPIDAINRAGLRLPQVCYRPQLGPIQTCDCRIVEVNGKLVRARSVGRCTADRSGSANGREYRSRAGGAHRRQRQYQRADRHHRLQIIGAGPERLPSRVPSGIESISNRPAPAPRGRHPPSPTRSRGGPSSGCVYGPMPA